MTDQYQIQQMTAQEQRQWWMLVAHQALHASGWSSATCEWIGYTHNAVFAVQTNQKRAVLRLRVIAGDEIDAEQAEIQFLRRLQTDTDLIAPVPLNDLLLLQAELPDRSTLTISATLFDYLEGVTPQPDQVSPQTLALLGQYLAALHHYGRRYHDPVRADDTGTKAGDVLNRRSPQFPPPPGRQSFYSLNPAAEAQFTTDQQNVLGEVAECVAQVMQALGNQRDVFGLIHGDLLLKNVMLTASGLGALDFEYFGWGYHVYDLTPVLWQLQPFADYETRKQALLAGYQAVRQLNQAEQDALETFLAARQAASMRWIVANRNNPHIAGKAEAILEQRSEELKQFLATGQLRRQ